MEEFGCIMNSIFVILTFVATLVTSKKDANYYSRETTSGTILSRGFPYSYNSSEVENFYFHGEGDESVQIVFEEFNLYRKSSNQRCGTDNSYISYQKKEKGEWEKFCGDKKPLPIMSEGNNFHLRYEPIMVPANNPIRERSEVIGFNATFRFLTNYGIESGKQDDNCEFYFNSSVISNGTFNSPNYPGTYPTILTCYYYFISYDKYIVLNFTEFNLLGSEDCQDVDRGKKDYVQVFFSSDSTSKEAPHTLCGNLKTPYHVVSPNQTLFVVFYHKYTNATDYELAEYPFVGFNASFLFTNDPVSASSHNQLPDFLILSACLYQFSKLRRIHF